MAMARIGRNSHFLGAKLRALRKQNRMTLEELSMRCIQIDAQSGPSVSYLSMIESGRRVDDVSARREVGDRRRSTVEIGDRCGLLRPL